MFPSSPLLSAQAWSTSASGTAIATRKDCEFKRDYYKLSYDDSFSSLAAGHSSLKTVSIPIILKCKRFDDQYYSTSYIFN